MKARQTLKVVPRLPERLSRLLELAFNLRWCWDHWTRDLFTRLDPELWTETGHNPVLLLGRISQEALEKASKDEAFMAQFERVLDEFDEYMSRQPAWASPVCSGTDSPSFAYFSAEFGLTECLPIYSGGLGVLAGDHLKSASDLGLPLVGVGILYQKGYFRQYLSSDGWQQEHYPSIDVHNLPLTLVRGEDGSPVTIEVEYPERHVKVRIWQVVVGRIRLLLLDTNIPENTPEDQNISYQLYGGDLETRIRQEILLGIGGVKALTALGIHPKVFHMNEGHSAFLALERIRMMLKDTDLSFSQAREATAAGNVFTTHTPVPAGIDVFPATLVEQHFSHLLPALKISWPEFASLGRTNPQNEVEGFSMAVLAIRLASQTNGVSKLHAQVSRQMWHGLWPGYPVDEVPIIPITNGIHMPTWTCRDISGLFSRYVGTKWRDSPEDPAQWKGIDSIPDRELWQIHQRRKHMLVDFSRQRMEDQIKRRGGTTAQVAAVREMLNPEALTIGFGRRVVTYKRATLIFRDIERLSRIVGDAEQPVQFLIAGKAHPSDHRGKEFIREIVQKARRADLRGRIVFLEDYDMDVSQALLSGADVWLNNPRRPMEASGTSGMKGAMNGVLNLSVLDGWWAEGYESGLGWAIGRDEHYDDVDYQDLVESRLIYDLLEQEVVPLFYDRDSEGIPRGWVSRMKEAMKAFCPVFNTQRMVREYADRFYGPAARNSVAIGTDGFEKARSLAEWKQGLRQHWANIHIEEVEAGKLEEVSVGATVEVRAKIQLGDLNPEDVAVEIYNGPVDSAGAITNAEVIPMQRSEALSNGNHVYVGALPLEESGLHGYSIRILPSNPLGGTTNDLGLIIWQ